MHILNYLYLMGPIRFQNKRSNVVYEYDGIYEDTFVHEHPELFVFDGTYKVPE